MPSTDVGMYGVDRHTWKDIITGRTAYGTLERIITVPGIVIAAMVFTGISKRCIILAKDKDA